MKLAYLALLSALFAIPSAQAQYERNKAVPVQQVLFGQVQSVRKITQQELVEDQRNGWATFGGALLGGVIGNQFGGGSGRTAATILGSIIGGSVAHNRQNTSRVVEYHLIELMVKTEDGNQFMVVQDQDPTMQFQRGDQVRLVYLGDNSVRVDLAY